MSKTKNNVTKKPIKYEKKDDDFLEEETDKKSIFIILGAIVVVLGLIFVSSFVFKEEEDKDGEEVEIKLPTDKDEIKSEEVTTVVKKVTSETIAATTTYNVIYLDKESNQIGQTQVVTNISNKIEEEAPIISGFRFIKWTEILDENTNTYYYVATYRQNVERVPNEDEKYLDEEKEETANTYAVEISETEKTDDNIVPEEVYENPTYDVTITGEVEELTPEEIDDELTIDDIEYAHIVALRFNAPQNITKEQIENMTIKVSATNETETITEDQYHYKGEDTTLSGRDLLDSTDEEYENGEYYFYYYQEVDTKTEVTLEVYWGNDPQAGDTDEDDTTPEVEPKDEYVEVYNINPTEVKLENEQEV